MRFLALYGGTLAAFLALDALWLGVVARGFYARLLGEMLRDDPRWGGAATLRGFPVRMVVVDLAWGTLLTGLVAGAGYAVGRGMGMGG